ncbi:hypothetical protein OV090_12840 [Nannocystis sp. RBIL2]|uniref:hypothetical protein n=1 Tax=Nannocystis sp. RBIL2 TaxID=2996788 RepID=UPI00226E29C6|nr:hypothetical protein [Nannocystis sp. RBIL2]MCY1065660.1 hypothetical protein [Nannocystis sp. RBIL2]
MSPCPFRGQDTRTVGVDGRITGDESTGATYVPFRGEVTMTIDRRTFLESTLTLFGAWGLGACGGDTGGSGSTDSDGTTGQGGSSGSTGGTPTDGTGGEPDSTGGDETTGETDGSGVTPKDITTVSLTAGTSGELLPWTIGHFFAEGDIPSEARIAADVDEFQAVVRNRWPDGSVKFAVLSGRCDFTAGTPRIVKLSRVAEASDPAPAITEAELVAAAPDLGIQVGMLGAVSLASALGNPVQQILSGPVASEWRYRLDIDDQLVVWLFVRLYKGGAVETLVSVENGWFDYTGATNKIGRVVATSQDKTLYDSTSELDIKHHTRIVCTDGHSGKLWLDADPQIVVAHDPAYLQQSGAVPAFLAESINETLFDNLADNYVPYAQHNLPGDALGSGGDSPSIGWLSQWDATYVVSAAPRALQSVLVNSFASGAWSVHIREAATNAPPTFAAHPDAKLPQSTGDMYGGRAYFSGQYGTDWDISHGWLPGYVAYLVTGDWWHLEELQYFVKWVHFSTSVESRGGAAGLMVRSLQPRGTAWQIRNCGMAAAITPDDDPEHLGYAGAVGASLAWMRGFHTNALGVVIEPDQVYWGDIGGERTWMSDYVVGSVAWVLDLKVVEATHEADATAFMEWMGKGLVQRMSDGTNPEGWHWAYQAYSPILSTFAFPENQDQAKFDANWGIAFERFAGRPNGPDLDDGNIHATNWDTLGFEGMPVKQAFGGDYFEYAMCALAQCVNRQVEGAEAAFARIAQASNFPACRAALAGDPRWGIAPRSFVQQP